MNDGIGFNQVIKYDVSMELMTPMHVGSSFEDTNEVLVHPVDGFPFVQASSISGAMRDYYSRQHGEKTAEELFGGIEGNGSRLVITDGYFKGKDIRFEMRPRISIDPASGTVAQQAVEGTGVISGHKFDMECIAKGMKFGFQVYVRSTDSTDADKMMDIFSAMHSGAIILGGQKSNGFGRVKVTELLEKTFDLRKKSDREAWIEEERLTKRDYTDRTNDLAEFAPCQYRILLRGSTESGILVKGYQKEGFGQEGADAVSMRDANGDYFIPGSSIKGALRNQIERIITYRGDSKEINRKIVAGIFGEAETGGRTGNIRVYDSMIEVPSRGELPVSQRIHIDKFTGGVTNGGLFSEQRAYGTFSICIDIMDKNNPTESCGYLIMAMRDLALNLYNLGGEYSIGNGMIQAETMTVASRSKEAVIDFGNGTVKDDEGIIDECVRATKEA